MNIRQSLNDLFPGSLYMMKSSDHYNDLRGIVAFVIITNIKNKIGLIKIRCDNRGQHHFEFKLHNGAGVNNLIDNQYYVKI